MKYKKSIRNWETVDEDKLKFNLHIFGNLMAVTEVYALIDYEHCTSKDEVNSKLKTSKDEVNSKFNAVIDERSNSREIILAGDFNARIGKRTKHSVFGSLRENNANDNGDLLI